MCLQEKCIISEGNMLIRSDQKGCEYIYFQWILMIYKKRNFGGKCFLASGDVRH